MKKSEEHAAIFQAMVDSFTDTEQTKIVAVNILQLEDIPIEKIHPELVCLNIFITDLVSYVVFEKNPQKRDQAMDLFFDKLYSHYNYLSPDQELLFERLLNDRINSYSEIVSLEEGDNIRLIGEKFLEFCGKENNEELSKKVEYLYLNKCKKIKKIFEEQLKL